MVNTPGIYEISENLLFKYKIALPSPSGKIGICYNKLCLVKQFLKFIGFLYTVFIQ